MFGSILPRPSWNDHLFSSGNGEPSGEPAGGGTGGGGGEGGGTGGGSGSGSGSGSEGTPAEKQVPQSKVDEIVQTRVGETKKSTEEAIAKQLGVPIEEAKRLIADAKRREDAEKSEAQLAKEAADAEKAQAETDKAEAAKAKHEAALERALIRALPNDLDDEVLDKKVTRLARLLDVEVGTSAEDIAKAVKALKAEEPEMFGVAGNGTGKPAPKGDPEGKPPRKTGAEGAYERGQRRAKERSGPTEYPILSSTNTTT